LLVSGGFMEKKKISLIVGVLFLTLSCQLIGQTAAAIPTQIPATLPTQPPGSITGVLWHDICVFTGGESGQPVVLGRGCIQWGTAPEEFGPNQQKDDFEKGWAGVTLRLGKGKCPSTGLTTAITDASGSYQFGGLKTGLYCVSYSNITDKNDAILIPGQPTFPVRGDGGFSATVDLGTGEIKTVNFGYAWQFFN
jgi:hypothetical protein